MCCEKQGSDWIEVKWVCLTLPKLASRKEVILRSSRFVDSVAYWSKCHICCDWGYEQNHTHPILKVRADELEKFQKRIKKFNPSKAWIGADYSFEDWNNDYPDLEYGHRAYRHALVKHEALPTHYRCPKHYKRCRNGQCDHIPMD